MRIVIVASKAQSLMNFRGRLIEDLLALGHEVHAVAPDVFEDKTTHAWLGQRDVRCHVAALSRTGISPRADLRTLKEFVRIFRQVRPDLVFSYTIKPVIWGTLAAWIARVPERVALITGLGYAFVGEAKGKRAVVRFIASRLYSTALKHATLVFFQNPDDLADFKRWRVLPAQKQVEIVNGSGVDTDAYEVTPMPEGPVKFLMIARLLRDKGIREYLAAARIVRRTRPDVEFHLVGGADPSPDGISEQEVAKWHMAGEVIWHGQISDVRDSIAQAHVFVLPSYREGTPRTVLEAMSMGRPVITTNAPGCRQTVVCGFNGFLVPVMDSAALAEAMENFLTDPSMIEPMGTNGRRMAEDVFDVRLVNTAMLTAMDLN